jgi:hypothetical protein
MPVAGSVAIVGTATTRFGVLHDRGYLDLLAEAALGAIADAGLEPGEIEAAWLGTSSRPGRHAGTAWPRPSASPAPAHARNFLHRHGGRGRGAARVRPASTAFAGGRAGEATSPAAAKPAGQDGEPTHLTRPRAAPRRGSSRCQGDPLHVACGHRVAGSGLVKNHEHATRNDKGRSATR